MTYEEYGSKENPTVVFLHGANYVHSFSKQYFLSENYHILVPHIEGFGNEAGSIFTTETAVEKICGLIREQGKKVTLVGFSLGAQLGYVIAARYPELLCGAVLISPWLIKEEKMLSFVMEQNEKSFRLFKKKWLCSLIGRLNGMTAPQRKEFVGQMQQVQLQTIRNSVDNGITTTSEPSFSEADIPILVLAGGKEQDEVKQSAVKLSEINPHCRYEIWEKAAHNIPPMFAKKLNPLLEKFLAEANK